MPIRSALSLGRTGAAVLLALFLTACAAPQGPRVLLSDEDHVYALQGFGGGQYEIEAGQLAAARGADPRVQAYGRTLVEHHAAANAQLLALLQARGITPAPVLPSVLAMRLARLAPLAGPQLDREFVIVAGVEDHRRQIALFEQASRNVRDPALRAWFAAQLPMLQAHLQAARQVLAAPGG